MTIVGYQILLRITRFVILVIRPDYQKFCLRSTPVGATEVMMTVNCLCVTCPYSFAPLRRVTPAI